ncbi:hypothetical protein Prudu_018724 [Prunus dulcis]|uniref:Uncharacterized protein n=1 Tax=Prunus dulcis TaxID=3755 RepID=A0A4Y1QNX0_PRUDU|nr:hypothetical protein Prudu_001543 [Prunus dulcis]BBH06947.1 hypothetical protein Prudu_018724 [Prunus dulcis]
MTFLGLNISPLNSKSVDELLPLCHKFNGYVAFQGALVYPETVAVLRKFMDKYGNFMEATDITPSFSRCAVIRALSLALHGIDTMQLLDITDHKLFCWWDAICEAITLGFHVDFLLNLVKDLARAVFGARAIRSSSADNAECVTEAVARASPRASSVLFGRSPLTLLGLLRRHDFDI